MSKPAKIFEAVSAKEESAIDTTILQWVNQCPEIPKDIYRGAVSKTLMDGYTSMAVIGIQSAYMTRQYILGGHIAEYPFKLVYRILPANSIEMRLKAEELLNKIGRWAVENPPELGEGIKTKRVSIDARAGFFSAYTNGDEDYQILMTLQYEVI